MLATLSCHLKTDFFECICILDDDKKKDGISYISVPVLERNTQEVNPAPNGNYLITSLENLRGIYNKIVTYLQARRIVTPIVI